MAIITSVVAVRATCANRSRTSPESSSRKSKPSLPKQLAPPAVPLSFAAIVAVAAPSYEAHAVAFTKEDIAGSLTKVEETIDQFRGTSSQVLELSLNAFKVVSDALKPGVDAALPVLQSASQEVAKIASPMVSDASKQAKEALQSAGIDPNPVLSAAKTVADVAQQSTKVIQGAKPIAAATVETITSSDPSVILVGAGGAFLAYLLLPPIWSVISFGLRGYKGNLTSPQALDMLSTKNYLLIDIRSEKDKSKAGIPELTGNAKNKLIPVPLEELPNKIKGLVRNVKRVEAEIAALKISYLKRVNKGSNIIIMDSYADASKTVAKTLTSFGFSNCWVMAGGFSGRNGWSQSRLGTDSYNTSLIEVLSPSRIIPAAAGRFGTNSGNFQSPRKLLPGNIDS